MTSTAATDHIRVLIDVEPAMLADALAVALLGTGIRADVATRSLHPGHAGYDLVIVDGAARLEQPARMTLRVDPTQAGDLRLIEQILALLADAPAPARQASAPGTSASTG